MPSTRTFHRTVIQIEVLSEDPFYPHSLQQIARAIEEDCSGDWSVTERKVLDGKEAATLLMEQGSDPEFFRLDVKGDDLDEEFIEVEYDVSYWGGDYSGMGDTAYVPVRLVEQVGMEKAFQQTTGTLPAHIIHWTEEEVTREELQEEYVEI